MIRVRWKISPKQAAGFRAGDGLRLMMLREIADAGECVEEGNPRIDDVLLVLD